jgi:hypothetical protein
VQFGKFAPTIYMSTKGKHNMYYLDVFKGVSGFNGLMALRCNGIKAYRHRGYSSVLWFLSSKNYTTA